ncbi:hypothetical protein RMATCC62417_06359 [Rhizopus microsporus]|nr:hypothetical protein RMATCC62417_06359 [Rhizopus microsporus]
MSITTTTTTTNTTINTSKQDYDNRIKVIQLTDNQTCQCQSFMFSHDCCSDCSHIFHNTFQPTQTQLTLLQSQKEAVVKERQDLDNKITVLEQTIEEKQRTIQKTIDNVQSMEHDLKILKLKCEEEAVQVQVIQKSKETVKKELEELNQKLFEEADKMVNIEKKEQEKIREENNKLQNALDEVQDQLKTTSSQLKSLKSQIMKPAEVMTIDHLSRAQLELMIANKAYTGLQMEAVEDDAALMDFNDFIQQASHTPLRKLHLLKYMKYCIREDIEPCLRFGPNPRTTSKKIMDAILVKTCFVEECPQGFVNEECERHLKEEATATLWERFTNGSVFLGCQACGRKIEEEEREQVLKYRFRISYFDEWACVDRYCRDRLMAVMEFYSLIRHIRAGLYKFRSLHELYQQMIRLRLQMFLARMGALPYMLSSCQLNPQTITTAFHGEEHVLPYLNERLSSSTDSTITSISTVETINTLTSLHS